MEYKITDIQIIDTDDIDNREVHVTLDNGTTITIVACYESWQQYGGTKDELCATVDVANHYNDWLHGGEEPDEYDYSDTEIDEDDFVEITRNEVIDFITETGINLFGFRVEEVAEAIADEVVEEYNEACDGDLQKAIRYVVLDQFGAL